MNNIKKIILESIALKTKLTEDHIFLSKVEDAIQEITTALKMEIKFFFVVMVEVPLTLSIWQPSSVADFTKIEKPCQPKHFMSIPLILQQLPMTTVLMSFIQGWLMA